MTNSTFRIVISFTVAALLVLGLLINSSPTAATEQVPDCFGELVHHTCAAGECFGVSITCAYVPCQVCNDFGCRYIRAKCLGDPNP